MRNEKPRVQYGRAPFRRAGELHFHFKLRFHDSGDDSIALNCPEGYSGNISRVAVTNCTFNSLSLMRLYTTKRESYKFNIDTVSVSICLAPFRRPLF